MRLSTDPRRDEDRAKATLRAALEAGATLLDTADAYAHDETERGHNERLIASEARHEGVIVATKGGLTRPGARWIPDGRARHLREACEASLRALDVASLDLYQLHAPDPRVPLATSVRALAKLKDEGLVRRIGLCNVNAAQLREACDLAPIDAVQIALSPFDERGLRSGVPELANKRGLLCLAHSPLGGPKRASKLGRDPVFTRIAAKHGTSAAGVVLAWLYELGAIPLPGATKPETAREAVRAASIAFDEEDRRALDERLPLGRLIREPPSARPARAGVEVVIFAGIPGAGKTTRVHEYVDRGYARLNRDEVGGTLAQIATVLDSALAGGTEKCVLDNTYATRASRHEILEIARAHGAGVRCVWLDTPLEDAQINAVERMIARHGRVLSPEEMKAVSRRDAQSFAPGVQHRFARDFEAPDEDEGFTSIERITFARRSDPSRSNPALVVSLEAFADVRRDPIRIDRERTTRLREESVMIASTAWIPGAGAAIEARLEAVWAELGRALPIAYCPHPAGPPICWCRKPLPGLALTLMHAHAIDPARSRWVGTSAADRSLAKNLGFEYVDAAQFFSTCPG